MLEKIKNKDDQTNGNEGKEGDPNEIANEIRYLIRDSLNGGRSGGEGFDIGLRH